MLVFRFEICYFPYVLVFSSGSSDDGGILKVLEVLDRVAAILRTVTRELDIE